MNEVSINWVSRSIGPLLGSARERYVSDGRTPVFRPTGAGQANHLLYSTPGCHSKRAHDLVALPGPTCPGNKDLSVQALPHR